MDTQRARDMNPPSTADKIDPRPESEPLDHHDHKEEVRKVFPYSVHEKTSAKGAGR